MLGCPLATHSNTLWLTVDPEKYWRRFMLAVGLSVGFHVILVMGFFMYSAFSPAPQSITLNSGSLALPVHIKLITETTQAASIKKRIQEVAEQKSTIDSANSENKTIKQSDQIKTKENKSIDQSGNGLANANASVTEKSEVVGLSQTVTVMSEPRYRVTPQPPEYPAQAQRRRQEGVVIIDITVEPNGRTADVDIRQSSGYALLDQAAVKAAMKWEIMPHEINGQAVRAAFQVPVKFELT